MLQTLIIDTVGPVPIYKNRPVPIQSAVDRMGFRISTKICSNSNVEILYSLRFHNVSFIDLLHIDEKLTQLRR